MTELTFVEQQVEKFKESKDLVATEQEVIALVNETYEEDEVRKTVLNDISKALATYFDNEVKAQAAAAEREVEEAGEATDDAEE